MKTVMLLLKVHLRSAIGALRNDTRTRIAWCVALGLDGGVGLWSINQLLGHVSQWQAAGSVVLEGNLWLLFSGAWLGIGLFASLSTITLGFGRDQPRLLMTLPISPAARFRVLYGSMFFEGIGNWLLLAVVVLGLPLIITLGWLALLWLLLLLLGVAVIVWMSIVVILLVFRYVLPHLKKALLFALVTCVGVGFIYLVSHSVGITRYVPELSTPAPLLVCLLLIMILALVVGPFARSAGRVYVEAFHEMEGRARSQAVINLPGIRLLSRWLGRCRNLTGALLVKGLLNQAEMYLPGGVWP